MGIKLRDITSDTVKTSLTISGEVLNIEFRRNFYTPAAMAEVAQATTQLEHIEAQIRLQANAITEWDLLGEDEKPLPIVDKDGKPSAVWFEMSIATINSLWVAMIEAVSPNLKRGDS